MNLSIRVEGGGGMKRCENGGKEDGDEGRGQGSLRDCNRIV